MIETIERYYLEIHLLEDLNCKKKPSEDYSLELLDPKNFGLSKFLYKQVGKKYQWTDRLIWQDQKWESYLLSENIKTYIFKKNEDLVGYIELIFNKKKKECEIAYFGILEEFFGKNLGGYFLSESIKIIFKNNIDRIWVHTCSLDHPNAIENYKARGMKVFKTELLKRKAI